jgi:hypothetical protein
MKLDQLKEVIARGGPFYPDVGVPDQRPAKQDPAQGLINDLLEFRARCTASREQAMSCGEIVRELDKMIRKNYGAMTDI